MWVIHTESEPKGRRLIKRHAHPEINLHVEEVVAPI